MKVRKKDKKLLKKILTTRAKMKVTKKAKKHNKKFINNLMVDNNETVIDMTPPFSINTNVNYADLEDENYYEKFVKNLLEEIKNSDSTMNINMGFPKKVSNVIITKVVFEMKDKVKPLVFFTSKDVDVNEIKNILSLTDGYNNDKVTLMEDATEVYDDTKVDVPAAQDVKVSIDEVK